jgi:hypothetical protein
LSLSFWLSHQYRISIPTTTTTVTKVATAAPLSTNRQM